jgi:sec-independent protein translocase protein TatB
MFDLGWTELLVIGVVALIVVGPKDLPGMFRAVGRFTAKAKNMAREFSRAMEDAADGTGVKEMSADLKNMTSARNLGLDAVKDVTKVFDPTATTGPNAPRGPETAKLTEERAEVARKIREATTKREDDKRAAAEAELEAETEADAKPAPKKPTAKKAPAKKAAAKKPAAKKAASTPKAKQAAKKPARKPAAKKKQAGDSEA